MSLHSTMFLLIRDPLWQFDTWLIYFTFHDVSINTTADDVITALIPPLHSTMFLLIRKTLLHSRMSHSSFTFHDVSINTDEQLDHMIGAYFFTFHDVSINTVTANSYFKILTDFTFHDVSINTRRLFILTIQI